MFAVMVNDLLSHWRAKFVDDLTALEIIPRNSPSMTNFIVDDTQRFAVKNNMRLNPPKSMTINFLHYNGCVVSPIVTGGSTVEQVSSFKLLGLFISEELTWNIHCDYVLKKSNKRLYILRQLFKCGLAKSEIVSVYCTLIRPLIEYASVVFSNLPTYLSKLIENIQKRALKIIWPDVTYTEALHNARLISLSERRSDACVKFVMGVSERKPLFPLVYNRVVNSTAQYALRSKKTNHPRFVQTDRFANFVTVKYQCSCSV